MCYNRIHQSPAAAKRTISEVYFMKVTVINGSMRHGSTWHIKEEFIRALGRYGEISVTEFTLPRDMPNFCRGCFSCFYKGEGTCPDAQFIAPIVKSMEESDIIVITSPVYGFDISGQLKSLIDHLCFMWVSHRPNPKMFNKAGVTISTTAGMGGGHATKTMRNSFSYWGVKRIYSIKKAVAASKWDEVKEKKRGEIEKAAARTAAKAAKAVRKKDSAAHRLSFKVLFSLMRGMQKKNDWNLTDRAHWESNGWFDGRSPFKG